MSQREGLYDGYGQPIPALVNAQNQYNLALKGWQAQNPATQQFNPGMRTVNVANGKWTLTGPDPTNVGDWSFSPAVSPVSINSDSAGGGQFMPASGSSPDELMRLSGGYIKPQRSSGVLGPVGDAINWFGQNVGLPLAALGPLAMAAPYVGPAIASAAEGGTSAAIGATEAGAAAGAGAAEGAGAAATGGLFGGAADGGLGAALGEGIAGANGTSLAGGLAAGGGSLGLEAAGAAGLGTGVGTGSSLVGGGMATAAGAGEGLLGTGLSTSQLLSGAGLLGSLGAGIFGANAAADAQTDAAKLQQQTANADRAFYQKLYDDQVARNKPFYDSGVTANSNLDRMMNGGYNMQESPAARYQLTQGSRSLNRQLAARGLLGSGNASQKLAELSAGVAANDWNDRWNKLTDQVKIGTGASANTGNAATNLGSQINATGQQIINAQGNAGNARSALYSGLGGLPSQILNTGINASRAGLFDGLGSNESGL